jgi:hypothetical protein
MNRYQTRTPRTLFALAAAALTAVTLGLVVVAPAGIAPAVTDAPTLATASTTADAPIQVTILPEPIMVFGVRERAVTATHESEARGNRG